MSEFLNRQGSNLNKKRLIVNEIKRDQTNEIIELDVEEIRNDNVGLSEEGTKLTANKFKEIIEDMINTEIGKIYLNPILVVSVDKTNLVLNTEVTENFTLPTVGTYGSTITWSVEDNSHISLSGNQALVTLTATDATVELTATIAYNTVIDTKTFNLHVNSNDYLGLDKSELTLPYEATGCFLLPTVGTHGSTITWQKLSGTGITINDNIAVVTRSTTDTTTGLRATLTYNGASINKDFVVMIPRVLINLTNTNYFNQITRLTGENDYVGVNSSISSVNNQALYINIVDYDDNLLIATIDTNSVPNPSFNLYESSTLKNLPINLIPSLLNYTIEVYLDSDHTNCVAQIIGTIVYHGE